MRKSGKDDAQSPAYKGRKEMLRRKIRRPSSRSLASAFGVCNSPVLASEIYTESSPVPSSSGENDNSFQSLGKNPFKVGGPSNKRVKVLQDNADLNSSIPLDWDDETANDAFSSPASNVSKREYSFSRSMSTKDASTLLSDYPLDFSAVMDSPHSSSVLSSPSVFNNTQSKLRVHEEKCSDVAPLDCRIGTRLRITSNIPLPWMSDTTNIGQVHVKLSGKEQADGTTLFMNTTMAAISEDCPSMIDSRTASSGALLYAASLYFQYPVLPWLSLFPRLSSQMKMLKDKVAAPLAPTMIDHINMEWSESFEALFLSWKKGERHSFYVCCPNITVFFTRRKEERHGGGDCGEASLSCFQTTDDGMKHVAIITPTTSGFRRFLREEGIQAEILDEKSFVGKTMSRADSVTKISVDDESTRGSTTGASRLSAGSENDCNSRGAQISFQIGEDDKEMSLTGDEEMSNEKKEEMMSGEDEDTSPTKMGNAHNWLKDIGVSPASTIRMKRHNTALGRLSGGSCSSSTNVNSRPNGGENEGLCSVVVRDASSVQALYDLLLTSKSVRAIAGQHASLPPTLIATQPFIRSQLQPLKKSSQVLRRGGKGMEFIMELDGGPILPHSVAFMTAFIRSCLQEKNGEGKMVIRVNERNLYAGINALNEEAEDWTELSVQLNNFTWRK